MSNYFKLKRPFVSKTDKLPEGVIRDIAQLLKTIENSAVKMANAARSGKVAIKKCAPLQAKVDKEQNADKKTKLNDQLLKLKDEYADCLIAMAKESHDASKAFTDQIDALNKPETAFLSENQLEQLVKKMDELREEYAKAEKAAKDAARAAADAEQEAEEIADDEESGGN